MDMLNAAGNSTVLSSSTINASSSSEAACFSERSEFSESLSLPLDGRACENGVTVVSSSSSSSELDCTDFPSFLPNYRFSQHNCRGSVSD